MCFKAPKVQKTDPVAEEASKNAKAASLANAEAAYRKSKGLGAGLTSALGSRGVTGQASTTSALAYGKNTLG